MVKKRLKPLLPSLKEKKRYIAFEVISEDKLDYNDVERAILSSAQNYLGELGMGKAGLMFLEDKWDFEKQKGLLRVTNKSVDNLRATFALIEQINNHDVIVRSVGVSGILKKAYNRYIAG